MLSGHGDEEFVDELKSLMDFELELGGASVPIYAPDIDSLEYDFVFGPETSLGEDGLTATGFIKDDEDLNHFFDAVNTYLDSPETETDIHMIGPNVSSQMTRFLSQAEPSSEFGGIFLEPGGDKNYILVNQGSSNPQDSLREELAHAEAAERGFHHQKQAQVEKARSEVSRKGVRPSIDERYMDRHMNTFGDLIAYGICAEKGDTDMVYRQVIESSEGIEDFDEDNFSQEEVSNSRSLSMQYAINALGYTALPDNMRADDNLTQEGREMADRIDSREQKVKDYLHPDVKEEFDRVRDVYSGFLEEQEGEVELNQYQLRESFKSLFELYGEFA
jgi:hypothetical protein